MKIKYVAAVGLLAVAMPHAAEAGWRPLSEKAIDTATLKEWLASVRESEAVAETARNDSTIPDVKAAPAPAGEMQDELLGSAAADASADGVDMPAIPSVAVANDDELSIATSSYSTDIPDQAALETVDEQKLPDPFLIRLQVLLDRAHASPGVIDGFEGENTRKAVAAYEAMRGLPEDGEIDPETWAILAVDQGNAIKAYTITQADVDGRYVDHIPDDYAELAKMDWLGYQSPVEMLAERFHMDEDLLVALNPGADFRAVGTTILVADVGEGPTAKVARIVVDKGRGEIVAYDDSDDIVLISPATIGSDDTPSPSGLLMVQGVATEPTYSYNPAKNFKQADNEGPLTIPPGPNGPVGSTWIDLSKPTFGIHGTPYPSRIDKSRSHGCVRLTNWDVETLSKLVQPAITTVEFLDTAPRKLVSR